MYVVDHNVCFISRCYHVERYRCKIEHYEKNILADFIGLNYDGYSLCNP